MAFQVIHSHQVIKYLFTLTVHQSSNLISETYGGDQKLEFYLISISEQKSICLHLPPWTVWKREFTSSTLSLSKHLQSAEGCAALSCSCWHCGEEQSGHQTPVLEMRKHDNAGIHLTETPTETHRESIQILLSKIAMCFRVNIKKTSTTRLCFFSTHWNWHQYF